MAFAFYFQKVASISFLLCCYLIIQTQSSSIVPKRQLENEDSDDFNFRQKRNAHVHLSLIEKCDRENKKMIIRAANVTLSQFVDATNHQLWCKHARKLEIFALETITIDSDLNSGKDKEGLSVIMMAPEWIVNGVNRIKLSGIKGEAMGKAENGNQKNPNGTNGLNGNPGHDGGSFYGHYDKFTRIGINSGLLVLADGGNGGDGQDGGNGLDGQDGEDAQIRNFTSTHFDFEFLQGENPVHRNFSLDIAGVTLSHGKTPYPFIRQPKYSSGASFIHGGPGTPGGFAGKGGVGGLGGNPGLVHLSSSKDNVAHVYVRSVKGKNGNKGKSGVDGKDGNAGQGYICNWSGEWNGTMLFDWQQNCHNLPVYGAETGYLGAVELRKPVGTQLIPQEFAEARQRFNKFVKSNS